VLHATQLVGHAARLLYLLYFTHSETNAVILSFYAVIHEKVKSIYTT